ncbi:hypothetical protein Tco_1024224 [Tanacetum coccineum]
MNIQPLPMAGKGYLYKSLAPLNGLWSGLTSGEDLCALYQLVMDKYQDEIPQGFNRILWEDLTTMFHPIELDEVWKYQQNWNIMSWKLHNSSGVYTLQTDSDMIIYMLVEKKYPLMKKILLHMLKVKLTTKENSTMAMDLIKFIQQQTEDANVLRDYQ